MPLDFDRRSAHASAARYWRPLARFIAAEERIAVAAEARGKAAVALYEFVRFGIKQGWACLFGGLMVGLLLATHLWYPRDALLARYDFLTIAAVVIQIALLGFRLETWDEAKVILLFHVVGTAMEIFKTSAGSWLYPEPSVLRVWGVPLFTGFMYASVGSYIARVWRLFAFRFTRHPPLSATMALSIAIYANFFAHHFTIDLRLALFAVAAILFGRCWVHFRIWRAYRRMPLLLGFALVTLFIWLAENIATFSNTWIYPHQAKSWAMVSPAKAGSWFLLMIISYTMVSLVSRPASLTPSSPD